MESATNSRESLPVESETAAAWDFSGRDIKTKMQVYISFVEKRFLTNQRAYFLRAFFWFFLNILQFWSTIVTALKSLIPNLFHLLFSCLFVWLERCLPAFMFWHHGLTSPRPRGFRDRTQKCFQTEKTRWWNDIDYIFRFP